MSGRNTPTPQIYSMPFCGKSQIILWASSFQKDGCRLHARHGRIQTQRGGKIHAFSRFSGTIKQKSETRRPRFLLAQRVGFEPTDTSLHHTISNSLYLFRKMSFLILFFDTQCTHVKSAQNHIFDCKAKVCGNINCLQKGWNACAVLIGG